MDPYSPLSVCCRDSDQLRTAAQQPQVRHKLLTQGTQTNSTSVDATTHAVFELFLFFSWLTTGFCQGQPQCAANRQLCNLQFSLTLTSSDRSMWRPKREEFSHMLRANHTHAVSLPQVFSWQCERPGSCQAVRPGCFPRRGAPPVGSCSTHGPGLK